MTNTAHPYDPRERIRKLNRIITGWQKHVERMAKILGCFGTDKDVEEAATRLQARLSEAERKVLDLTEALEKIANQQSSVYVKGSGINLDGEREAVYNNHYEALNAAYKIAVAALDKIQGEKG